MENLYKQVRSFFTSLVVVTVAVIAYLSKITEFPKYAPLYFTEFWRGFTRVFNPMFATQLLNDQHAREVLIKSGRTNLEYALYILAYELLFKKPLQYIAPAYIDSKYEFRVDLLVRVLLAARYYMDNKILDAAVIQAGRLDHPEVLGKDKQVKDPGHFIACPHELTTRWQSILASSLYYTGNSAIATCLEATAAYVYIPTWTVTGTLKSLLWGHSLIELGVLHDQCTQHRNDILININWYKYGLGLSYYLSVALATKGIEYVCGLKSSFVRDALSALIYHQFLTMMMTVSIADLPSKKLDANDNGLDITHLGREFSRQISGVLIHRCMGYYKKAMEEADPNAPLNLNAIWKQVESVLTNPGIAYLSNYMLRGSWATKEAFLNRDLVRLLYKYYHRMITTKSMDLATWRENIALYEVFLDFIPTLLLPEYKKLVVSTVSDPQFESWLEKARQVIYWIGDVQGLSRETSIFSRRSPQSDGFILASDMDSETDHVVNPIMPREMNESLHQKGDEAHISEAASAAAPPSAAAPVSAGRLLTPLILASKATSESISSANLSADSQVREIDPDPLAELDAVRKASLPGTVVAKQRLFTPAPVESTYPRSRAQTVTTDEFNAENILHAIIHLARWNQEGYSYYIQKCVPDGIEKLRSCTNISIEHYFTAIEKKFQGPTVTRSAMTDAFYLLIQDCYLNRLDRTAIKRLILEFANTHLYEWERVNMKLQPQRAGLRH